MAGSPTDGTALPFVFECLPPTATYVYPIIYHLAN